LTLCGDYCEPHYFTSKVVAADQAVVVDQAAVVR